MKKFDIQRFAKRRIQVGDNLTNVIIYSDIPDDYLNLLAEKANGVHRTFISAADSSNMSIADGYVDGDAVVQIDYPDDRNHFYNAWLDNGEIHIYSKPEQLQINFPDGNVANIDDTNESYRHLYIEDSNVRPIRAKDVINENTKIYFTWPDTLTPTGGGTSAVLYFNSIFQINYVPGENFKIEAISNLSIEERIVLFNSASNINKSYLDLSEFEEGASIAGTIEFQLASFPQEVLNGILVDETTLTSSGPEPTDPTLIFPINIRRIQIGDNLFQKYIYSDFPWTFDDTIQGGGNLTIIDTAGHDNSFYTILLPESGNSIIKSINKDTEYCLYWRESNQDNAIFGKRKFFIGENDTDTNKNNYIVTSLYLDGAWWGKGAYRNCYIEDTNIRPLQVGDRLVKNTKLYFNFPDNIYSYISTNISPFSSIFTVQGEDNGYQAGLWVFNEDGLATTGEQKISLVGEGWSPVLKEIYFSEDGNITSSLLNESIYILTEDFGEIDSISESELNNYILVDTTTLGKAPLVSIGTVSYKNGDGWNKLLSLAQEQIPLKGSIMPGPIKWSAVNSTTECTDSKTLYFVFGEEEASPTYETVNMKYTISNSAYDTANISSIGLMFNNDNNSKTILSYNNESSSFLPGVETKYIDNTLPQIFIDYTGEQLTVYGEIAIRDPETTMLLYNFSLNQQNVVSGQPMTFEPDSGGTSFSEAIHSGSVGCTIYINSASGQACLSEDTKIKTLNNDIYINDLELGDKVIDKDNQETEITKIYNHKINTVYQIHLDNNETIECSYDHKFLVEGGKTVTAAQLKENDKLGQHIITSIDIINKELDVYEIKTESNTYTLANGIICECENI